MSRLIVLHPQNCSQSFLSVSSSGSLLILSLPVSRIAEVLYPTLPPTPTAANVFRQQEGAEVGSSHPWASFTGVQAVGLQCWGQTPPSPTLQTKPSPTQTVPAFLPAAFSLFKKALSSEAQQLLTEGCFINVPLLFSN